MKFAIVFLSLALFFGCSTKQTAIQKPKKSSIDFSVIQNVQTVYLNKKTKYFFGPKSFNSKSDWFEVGTFLQVYKMQNGVIALASSKDGSNFLPLKAPVWLD